MNLVLTFIVTTCPIKRDLLQQMYYLVVIKYRSMNIHVSTCLIRFVLKPA